MIEAADLARKGLPPVAGGALDQTQVFLDACRFIWAETDHWRIVQAGPMAAMMAMFGG